MSFRIDDILRKENDTKSIADKMNCDSTAQMLLNYPEPLRVVQQEELQQHPNSILQQTLLHNKMFCNSAYNSEYNRNNWSYDSNKFYSTQYLDPYCEKDRTGISSYTRSHLWSPIYSHLPVYLPYLHYNKRKGGQVRFSVNQTDALERRFHSNKYLSPEDRKLLADSLKLSDRQVKTWFQNRRAKWRRCNSSGNSISEGDGIPLDSYEDISIMSNERTSNGLNDGIRLHSAHAYQM